MGLIIDCNLGKKLHSMTRGKEGQAKNDSMTCPTDINAELKVELFKKSFTQFLYFGQNLLFLW